MRGEAAAMGFASLDATVLSGVGTARLAHIALISRLKEMVRWLRPKKTHSLKQLWTIATAECRRIIPEQDWNAIDVGFVQRCIERVYSIA